MKKQKIIKLDETKLKSFTLTRVKKDREPRQMTLMDLDIRKLNNIK